MVPKWVHSNPPVANVTQFVLRQDEILAQIHAETDDPTLEQGLDEDEQLELAKALSLSMVVHGEWYLVQNE